MRTAMRAFPCHSFPVQYADQWTNRLEFLGLDSHAAPVDHLALVKTGNSFSFYLNGVLQNSTTATAGVPTVAALFQVGRAEAR